jgi:hypothetical protein
LNTDGDTLGDACDCDAFNRNCVADCTDVDGDGYCITHDCNDALAGCDADCTDSDADGFCPPFDCDEVSVHLSDRDADGVPDPCDNCPGVWNRDQADFDGFGPKALVSDAAINAWSVIAADLDGDGDNDVVSIGTGSWPHDPELAWYRNLDNAGSFGARNVITVPAYSARSLFAADLDGDEDIDILTSSSHDILWYENLNGSGSFGAARVISTLTGWNRVIAADVDGDGNTDVIDGRGQAVEWFRNTDGAGNFGPAIEIDDFDADWVHAADVDGDEDIDVLVIDHRSAPPFRFHGRPGR